MRRKQRPRSRESMGKQTGLHLLPSDCRLLLDYMHRQDPVVVTLWCSDTSAMIEEVTNPQETAGWYCLWNQGLLPSLSRDYVSESKLGPYYRVASVLPVIELTYTHDATTYWQGRRALAQGRIYLSSNDQNALSWYSRIRSWIRRNFMPNPIPLLGGYVGPAALDWYKEGGTLLPAFLPPPTKEWMSWGAAQDQHRAVFGCTSQGRGD